MTDAPATRSDGKLTVALVSEVFWEPDGTARLEDRLREAAERGADLAVLPELPAEPVEPGHQGRQWTTTRSRWTVLGHRRRAGRQGRPASVSSAGSSTGRRTVAGPAARSCSTAPGGSRRRTRSSTCPRRRASGRRATTSRAASRRGASTRSGCPSASSCARTTTGQRARICSAPRASRRCSTRAPARSGPTSAGRSVWRANALTSACYVLSVNRPHPEQGVLIGGPSVAIDPRGEVLVETTDYDRHRHAGQPGRGRCASPLSRLPAGAGAPVCRGLGRDRRDRWRP